MKISIKATNLKLTTALRDYVNKRIGGLEKFLKGQSHSEFYSFLCRFNVNFCMKCRNIFWVKIGMVLFFWKLVFSKKFCNCSVLFTVMQPYTETFCSGRNTLG